jgi:hypothetical protein
MKRSGLILLVIVFSILIFFMSCTLPSFQMPSCIRQLNNQLPTPYIDLIKPQLASKGDSISFIGHGIDIDGEIVGWEWRSDIDGELSIEPAFESNALSVGEHIIHFKVQDNTGTWSAETQQVVKVLGENSDLPRIADFSAYPANVLAGDSTTLYWNVAGATAIAIEPGIGKVQPNSSRTIIPRMTTEFKLIASNPAGSVTRTCQVNVSRNDASVSTYPVINYFTADDFVIVSGDVSAVNWSVSDATLVTIEPTIGKVAPSGTMPVCPVQSTKYVLTATNKTGSVTGTVSIDVAPVLQFAVTGVQTSAEYLSECTKCPCTLLFSFKVKASAAGIVTYYTESSTGIIGPTESLKFDVAGQKTIEINRIVTGPGQYYETMHIITPEVMNIPTRTVTIACAKVFNVTDVSCITGPISGYRPCPFTLSYTFKITADGPCIVQYYFEKSDGSYSPYQSVTFGTSGSKTINMSWTVSDSNLYWVKLVVVSPNYISATSPAMNLTCE